jgi:hypothetical protein
MSAAGKFSKKLKEVRVPCQTESVRLGFPYGLLSFTFGEAFLLK